MSYVEGYLLLLPVWAACLAAGAGLLVWARRRKEHARLALAATALLGLVLSLCLALFSEPRPGQVFEDLHAAYLSAARHVFVDPVALYREYSHGFVNIPIVAVPFVPLVGLPPATAGWAYALAGVAVAVAAAFGLARLVRASRHQAAWIAALFVACGPLYNSLREGNTTHWILAMLVGALLWLDRGRDVRAGALLGVCGVVKLPLFLLAAPLVMRGRWRAVLGVALGAGSTVLLSLALFGAESHIVWWNEILRPSAGRPVGAFNVQSLDGMWLRLLTGAAHLRDWQPVDVQATPFAALRWGATGLLLFATGAVAWRAGPPRTSAALRHEVVLALVLALLISPITWSHYYLWMLIPLALFAAGDLSWPAGVASRAALVAGGVLVCLPVQLLPFQAAFPRVGASLPVFGALSWWAVLLRARVGGAPGFNGSRPRPAGRTGKSGAGDRLHG